MHIMKCYAEDKKFNSATGEYDYTFLDLDCNEANKDNNCSSFKRKFNIWYSLLLVDKTLIRDITTKYCKDCKNYDRDFIYLNRR